MPEVKVRCPKCSWEPDGQPYWQCHCGHVWDTFSTGGRCPACKFRHKYTQCISLAGGCPETSPHLDWYEGLDQWLDSVTQDEEVPVWLRYADAR